MVAVRHTTIHRNLKGKAYHHEVLDAAKGKWVEDGKMNFHDYSVFHHETEMKGIRFHPESHSVKWSHGKGKDHSAGRLFFTQDGSSYVGSVVKGEHATPVTVRGSLAVSVYKTKLDEEGGKWINWDNLSVGAHWDDQLNKLVHDIKLGNKDVSDRSAVTNVDQWMTKLKMAPSMDPLNFDPTSFEIVIDPFKGSFTGTFTKLNSTVHNWTGVLSNAAATKSVATANSTAADQRIEGLNAQAHLLNSQPAMRFAAVEATDTSLQDLMNVSSITTAKAPDGTNVVVDVAQNACAKQFQYMLLNTLDDKWTTDFFGGKKFLGTYQPIYDKHKSWFDGQKSKIVTANMGQIIYDNFTDKNHQDIRNKINIKKIGDAWTDFKKDTGFSGIGNDIYINAYRETVEGIKPYLSDGPSWAQKLHDFLISPQWISIWQVQVSDGAYKNISQQIYEWNVQLAVLDPNKPELGQNMCSTMYAAMLHVWSVQSVWTDDVAKALGPIIQQMIDGTPNFGDEVLNNNAKKVQEQLAEMVTMFDNVNELTKAITRAMSRWAEKNKGVPMAANGANVGDQILQNQQVDNPKWYTRWGNKWKQITSGTAGKVFGALLYAGGAGVIIWQLATMDHTAFNIPAEIQMGLLATGFMVKAIQNIVASRIGNWFRLPAAAAASNFEIFAKNLGKWFTAGGVEVENWATKLLGKSSAEFMAKRLGPALAVVGVVVSAFNLYKAVKSGDVRDIVFESLNTLFALADVVFIGLDLLGFAWAGPVGLVIAAIGVVVLVVQFIWNLIDPPPPPPDPMAEFVNGPLKSSGFTNS